jgi:hypothetical protein
LAGWDGDYSQVLLRQQGFNMRVLIASILFVATWAQAQPLTLPTDADLKTAYCLKVTQSQYDYLNSKIGGEPKNSPAYPSVQKMLSEKYADVNRLKSYLLPRLQSLEVNGLIAAVNRAEADLGELDKIAEVCTPKCQGFLQGAIQAEKWNACVDNCRGNYLVVQRVDACKVVNWLPF